MGKHKALKGAIAAVASVATLGALQPSATATPRRSQARRWQVCGRIHRIQRRCSAFLRAQGQVAARLRKQFVGVGAQISARLRRLFAGAASIARRSRAPAKPSKSDRFITAGAAARARAVRARCRTPESRAQPPRLGVASSPDRRQRRSPRRSGRQNPPAPFRPVP